MTPADLMPIGEHYSPDAPQTWPDPSHKRARGMPIVCDRGTRPDLHVGERFNPYKLFTGIFIPEAICKYDGLSAGAKLAYGRLCRYAGENGDVYPSARGLGCELGISERQGRRYLRELEAKRFITVDRENLHYRGDGSGGTCRYFFLWHAAFQDNIGKQNKRKVRHP